MCMRLTPVVFVKIDAGAHWRTPWCMRETSVTCIDDCRLAWHQQTSACAVIDASHLCDDRRLAAMWCGRRVLDEFHARGDCHLKQSTGTLALTVADTRDAAASTGTLAHARDEEHQRDQPQRLRAPRPVGGPFATVTQHPGACLISFLHATRTEGPHGQKRTCGEANEMDLTPTPAQRSRPKHELRSLPKLPKVPVFFQKLRTFGWESSSFSSDFPLLTLRPLQNKNGCAGVPVDGGGADVRHGACAVGQTRRLHTHHGPARARVVDAGPRLAVTPLALSQHALHMTRVPELRCHCETHRFALKWQSPMPSPLHAVRHARAPERVSIVLDCAQVRRRAPAACRPGK